ncbi:MAG: nitroreductase family protein [Desulfobacterales bacterium]|jgi:nitroreductase
MVSPLDQIIASRHSVRAYDGRPVTQDQIRALCEAARMAPSACNSQTWRFVVVTRPETISRICRDAMRPVIPNRWLSQAPLLIVGCAKLDIVANRIGSRITGTEYYQIDMGIAMEHMVLKATELGLGSCWIGWFKEERLRQILSIPSRIKICALLAVGHPEAEPPKKRARKPLDRIVFSERWGAPFSSADED